MLRFVLCPRLAAPADHKQHRDRIHFFMQQRCRRIDDIAFPGILHIYNRNFSGRQMISGRDGCGVPFIGGDDMMRRVCPITLHQAVAKRRQQRIRHPCVKICPQQIDQFSCFHKFAPTISAKSDFRSGFVSHKISCYISSYISD